jgi:uncharacterized protein (DUF1697 family)
MKKNKYLVLLRGINVGGKNIIKMNELKILFEKLNYSDVKTYIQGGNVIFSDFEIDKNKLTEIIEKALFKKFKNKINIVILTIREMKNIISKKPNGFGEDSESKYDIVY